MKTNPIFLSKKSILLLLITTILSFCTLSAQERFNSNEEEFTGLELFLTQQTLNSQTNATQKLTNFIKSQKEKLQTKSDKKKYYSLFKAVQKKFLQNYTPYQELENTLNESSFDCLSGTAIYALILQEFECHFEIWEMQHHIFLIIHTEDDQQILIESTDPIHGFVLGQKNIKRRIASYRQEKSKNKGFYKSKQDFESKITLKELAGLQQYNLAVVDFNSQNFDACTLKLEKSLNLYNSPRSRELLLLSIAHLPSQKQNQLWNKYELNELAIAEK